MTGDHPDSSDTRRLALTFAVGRLAAGQRDALPQIHQLIGAKLFAVCLRILSVRADAEEALQDTYVSLWRNAAAFDPARSNPITWLMAIARNRAIDRLRARGNRPSALIEAADLLPDPAPGADAMMEAMEDEGRVQACLATLSFEEARLIRAAFYDDASYPDLAQRASLPLGTVKSRIRRALLKLRACLT